MCRPPKPINMMNKAPTMKKSQAKRRRDWLVMRPKSQIKAKRIKIPQPIQAGFLLAKIRRILPVKRVNAAENWPDSAIILLKVCNMAGKKS